MSIFNRNTDLRNIKRKEDFITLMSKGSGINYIGIQIDSGINIIKDIVYDYLHTLFDRELALITSITPTQMCYRLNSVINGYNYEVITHETYLTIQFKFATLFLFTEAFPYYHLALTRILEYTLHCGKRSHPVILLSTYLS